MSTDESSTPTLDYLPTSTTTTKVTNAEHVISHPKTAIANTSKQRRRLRLALPPGFTASDYRITCSTRREYSIAYKFACKTQSVQRRLEIHQHFIRRLRAAAQVERQCREDLRDSMVKASEMGYTGPVGKSGEKEWDTVWKVYSGRSRGIRQKDHRKADRQDLGSSKLPEYVEEMDDTQEEQHIPVISGWCQDIPHPLPLKEWPLGYLKHHSDQIEVSEHLTDAGTYVSTSDEGDHDNQRLLRLLPPDESRKNTMADVHCGSGAKQNVKRMLKKLRRKKKVQPEADSMPTTWSKLAAKHTTVRDTHLATTQDTTLLTGVSTTKTIRARSATIPVVLRKPSEDSHAYAGARAQDSASQTPLLGSHAYSFSPDSRERKDSGTAITTSTGARQRARSIPLVEFDSHGRLKLASQLELLLEEVNKGNEQSAVHYAEPFKALPDTESVENLRLTCGARLDQVSEEAAEEAREVIRKERELQLRERTTRRNTILNRAMVSTPTRATTSIPSSDKGPNGVYSPSGSTSSRLPNSLENETPASPTLENMMEEPSSSSPPRTQTSTPSPKSTTTSKSTPPSLLPRLGSSPPSRKGTSIRSKPEDQHQQISRVRRMYNKISKDTSTSNADVYANITPPQSEKKVRFTVFQDAESVPSGAGSVSKRSGFLRERNGSAKLKLKKRWEEQEDTVLEEARELAREDRRETAKAAVRLR